MIFRPSTVKKLLHIQRKMFDLRPELKLHTSMPIRATTLIWRLGALSILILAARPAIAQEAGSTPRSIVFSALNPVVSSFVATPNIGSSNTSSSSDNQWLKVEWHYSVVAPPDAVSPVGDFLNEVEFKVWIEGRDQLDKAAKPGGEGIAIALTGTVTYVNVPKGRDLYGVVYVHPDTLARYTNTRGVEEYLRNFDVHVEADVEGKAVDAADRKKEDDLKWFQQLRAVPGFVYRQDLSPFINANSDQYPAIKLPDSR